ncbi:MAG: molybdenum cofactor biosynthesis protein B [Polyangiaceae bacterium]
MIRVATITASDTRTPETDEGGRVLGELARDAGFEVASHVIVREDLEILREAVRDAAEGDVDAVLVTGGTGLGPRDVTIEAVRPLFAKEMEGFGEAFRRLSWDEVGARSLLSRATAGVTHTARGDRKIVVALPGSVNGVRLGMQRLVAPMLDHAVAVARGTAKHGPKA